MHDPLTVAFEIKYPWKGKSSELFPNGYRKTFITVWHKDPEHDGTDDSCDWFGWKRKLKPKEKDIVKAVSDMEWILDNRPFYPDHPAHRQFQKIKEAVRVWRQRPKFRWHPRYHFWHWRIQIVPLQMVIRWLFERCSICHKGYAWNEQIMGNWDGDRTWHFGCDKQTYKQNESEPAP